MQEIKLYNKFDNPEVDKIEIPTCILEGIKEKYILREYQEQALKRFIYYIQNKNFYQSYETKDLFINKNHLLFNIATGGGKTLLMACIILYLHNEYGYNNFLFLSHLNSINTKTSENFFNKNSNKYLFSNNVNIVKTDTFYFDNNNSINISITSYQTLNSLLNTPVENAFNLADVKNKRIVIIADEAHHLNAGVDEYSSKWEESVNKVLNNNFDNFLLEFTATINWNDKNLLEKYYNKCIYRYDLKNFYESGYTKSIGLLQRSVEIDNLMFGVIILSKYRQVLFNELKNNIKPVILFKSKTIKESEENHNKFVEIIKELDDKKIDNYYSIFKNDSENITKIAFDYLNQKYGNNLINILKNDFSAENILNTNKENEIDNNAVLLNTLEDNNNNIRVIFSVDKLNEGWDVLNLFDIVKLYKTQTVKETTREAQLIGRGARYCPFVYSDKNIYKRKFDDNNDYSILEQLFFHSSQDNMVISKLKAELENIGIVIDRKHITIEMNSKIRDHLKNEKIFINKKIKKRLCSEDFNIYDEIDKKLNYLTFCINFNSNKEVSYNLMNIDKEKVEKEEMKEKEEFITLADIDKNIKWEAIINNINYNFNNLYKRLELKSFDDFILRLDKNKVRVKNWENSNKNKYYLYSYLLKEIYDSIIGKEIKKFEGTKVFNAEPFNKVFRQYIDKKVIYKEVVFNDNYFIYNKGDLTSEEESFITFFQSIYKELKNKFDDIYLLRNEQDLKLYQFDNGVGFEPDFLLFLKKGDVKYQVYIEPKGDNLIVYDKDKNEFLKQITKFMSNGTIKLNVDRPSYKLLGLQFYNKEIEIKEKRMEKEIKNYLLD